MFSIRQKREISEKIQTILRETNHPELSKEEIEFHLHVKGSSNWSWADIKNNGAVINPEAEANPHNEKIEGDNKMIYKIKEPNAETISEEKKLTLSCGIDNEGSFILFAERESELKYRIFSLKKDGTGYLFSYIDDDIGLKLDSKGKLIIKEGF